MAHFRESGALHLEVLTQTPARNVPLEVDIFDGSNPGTLLESLEGATDISYEELHNEVGAGKWLVSVHDPKALAATVDREHLAKIKVGGIYRFSHWMEKRKIVSIGEGEEAEEHWSIGGREGTLAYLERAEWYHTSAAGNGAYIIDGRWRFTNVSAGLILKIALDEALARSPSPIEFLTYDFSGTVDSQGANWTKTTTIDVEFGTSLLDTARKLAAMGELDLQGRHDLRLSAFVARGVDRSAGSGHTKPVVFRAGHNIRTTLARTTSRPQVKTRMLVRSKGDQVFEVVRPDLEADPHIRRREGFLSFQDSADPTTVQRAAEADLAGRLLDQESITLGVAHGDQDGEYEPYSDYDVGDEITVHDPPAFDLADHRLVALALSSREDTFDVDLTLNSVEYEALLKLARKTGAYGSGSSGGTSSAVSGGTSTGGGSGTDLRVAVEAGDSAGLLYDKVQAKGGTVLSIEGVSGSRKVGIRSAESGVAGGFAPLSSGLLVPVAYLGTGAVGDGSTVLHDDGTWKVPSGGGGGGGTPLPAPDLSATNTQLSVSANTVLHTRTLTALPAGRYALFATLWVWSSGIGTITIRANGVNIAQGESSDPRSDVAERMLIGWYDHAGGDVTFDIHHAQESGTTQYGASGDARFGRTLLVLPVASTSGASAATILRAYSAVSAAVTDGAATYDLPGLSIADVPAGEYEILIGFHISNKSGQIRVSVANGANTQLWPSAGGNRTTYGPNSDSYKEFSGSGIITLAAPATVKVRAAASAAIGNYTIYDRHLTLTKIA